MFEKESSRKESQNDSLDNRNVNTKIFHDLSSYTSYNQFYFIFVVISKMLSHKTQILRGILYQVGLSFA